MVPCGTGACHGGWTTWGVDKVLTDRCCPTIPEAPEFLLISKRPFHPTLPPSTTDVETAGEGRFLLVRSGWCCPRSSLCSDGDADSEDRGGVPLLGTSKPFVDWNVVVGRKPKVVETTVACNKTQRGKHALE